MWVRLVLLTLTYASLKADQRPVEQLLVQFMNKELIQSTKYEQMFSKRVK